VQTLERRRRWQTSPPPNLLRLTASPSWNLTSPETKMARLPCCRDVIVLLWRVFQFAAITVPRSRRLARYASFLRVISTASLCDLRLWRQCGEGMWAFVRFEPAGFNVIRYLHIVTLFYCCFLRCLGLVKIQRHMADDLWRHYWQTRPDNVKTSDAELSFDSGWSLVVIELL